MVAYEEGVYLTGYTSGTYSHPSNGGWDCFLIKYREQGGHQWTRTWGGSEYDYPYGVDIDDVGGVYVTGYFLDIVDFWPGTGIENHTSNGQEDIFLLKMNENGNWD